MSPPPLTLMPRWPCWRLAASRAAGTDNPPPIGQFDLPQPTPCRSLFRAASGGAWSAPFCPQSVNAPARVASPPARPVGSPRWPIGWPSAPIIREDMTFTLTRP